MRFILSSKSEDQTLPQLRLLGTRIGSFKEMLSAKTSPAFFVCLYVVLGFELARHEHCHLSHAPNPFLLYLFFR
jgi:hypothetical protein